MFLFIIYYNLLMTSILIAEDDPSIMRLLTFSLKSAGYTVYGAVNGREALDFYNQNPEKVDLIMSDIIMPEMSGLELCRALQGKCPVVIVSANSDEDNQEQARLAGAIDFIAKPYDLKQLKTKLTEILQKIGKA